MPRIQLANTEDYFDLPFMSNSKLSRIWDEIAGKPFKPSEEAFAFGKVFDALLTQPDKADATHPKFAVALQMKQTWLKNPLSNVFNLFESQVPFVTDIQLLGENVTGKCLFDRFHERKGIGMDFKAVAAPTPKAWRQTIDLFGYDKQAVWYMNIGEIDEFWLVAFCKNKPWQQAFTTRILRGDEIYQTGWEKIKTIWKYHRKYQ